MSGGPGYSDPDLDRLMREKARESSRESLVEEIETLHDALHDATSTAIELMIFLKRAKRMLESMIAIESERDNKSYDVTPELSRITAEIVKAIHSAKNKVKDK